MLVKLCIVLLGSLRHSTDYISMDVYMEDTGFKPVVRLLWWQNLADFIISLLLYSAFLFLSQGIALKK